MTQVSIDKKFGLRITLAENNPMNASHLLGEDWESFRWYSSAAERDEAYDDVVRHMPNYRRGDHVAQVVEKIER